MSKIGRKPIEIKNVQVTIKDHEVHYKGPKNSGVYLIPEQLSAHVDQGQLLLAPADSNGKSNRDINRIWGLHRALLANAIGGASVEFEKIIKINGLGFKAVASG